jgi:hypothetical protein
MTSANPEPIWFNPLKFWAATRNMSPQQVDSLMDTLFFLAEIRNLEALSKFDFIGSVILICGATGPNARTKTPDTAALGIPLRPNSCKKSPRGRAMLPV